MSKYARAFQMVKPHASGVGSALESRKDFCVSQENNWWFQIGEYLPGGFPIRQMHARSFSTYLVLQI